MRRLAALCFLFLSLATMVRAQNADDAGDLLRRFDALPEATRLALVADIEVRLSQLADDGLQRIAAAATTATSPRPLRARTFPDPKVFAPVAPARTWIRESDVRHHSVKSDFPPVRVLRDLRPTVVYDWLAGEAALAPEAPTARERFANLCAGYPPLADAAIAAVLAQLDRDGDQRLIAQWCEQLYADRDGRVFEGITLYAAWYSGRVVEVPDVDAIAFARAIVRTDAYQSPIPEGRRRDRLYSQIRAAIKKHREYRTLCETAAAAFVTVSPELDPTYQPLVDRMHFLWGECGQDVARFASKLTESDRSELLTELDARITKSPEAYSLAIESKNERKALAQLVRQACREALLTAESK